jgi:PTS system D-glucosamine-specific IIC component
LKGFNTSKLVDKEGLKECGSRGVVYVGESGVQIIFGARSQFIAKEISQTGNERKET